LYGGRRTPHFQAETGHKNARRLPSFGSNLLKNQISRKGNLRRLHPMIRPFALTDTPICAH